MQLLRQKSPVLLYRYINKLELAQAQYTAQVNDLKEVSFALLLCCIFLRY